MEKYNTFALIDLSNSSYSGQLIIFVYKFHVKDKKLPVNYFIIENKNLHLRKFTKIILLID